MNEINEILCKNCNYYCKDRYDDFLCFILDKVGYNYYKRDTNRRPNKYFKYLYKKGKQIPRKYRKEFLKLENNIMYNCIFNRNKNCKFFNLTPSEVKLKLEEEFEKKKKKNFKKNLEQKLYEEFGEF
jgi:hypothetical protein